MSGYPPTPMCDRLSRTKDLWEEWARGGLPQDSMDALDDLFGIDRDEVERERRAILHYLDRERRARMFLR